LFSFNVYLARYGGACTAAGFLEHFVADGVKWAHLDIAGPAMLSKPHLHFNEGGTGFGAALLTQYLTKKIKKRLRRKKKRN
jgi:leucyl aminopeptidase